MSALKRGLFSVSYAGFWGQPVLTLEQSIEKAAELGFEGLLFMGKRPHLSPLDTDEKRLSQLRTCLESFHIDAIGVAAYNDFLLTAAEEIPVAEMQLSYIEFCCRAASALGGSLVRVFTGYTPTAERSGRPALGPSAAWRRVVELLRVSGERAAGYGITLVVQNHHDLAVGSEELELLIRDVGLDNVRVGYDAWSPYLRGEDINAAAQRMGRHSALTIAANYRRFRRYRYDPQLVNYHTSQPDTVRATFMSRGEIDYHAFLNALRAGGYNGWVVYEICSPLIEGSSQQVLDEAARDFLDSLEPIAAM